MAFKRSNAMTSVPPARGAGNAIPSGRATDAGDAIPSGRATDAGDAVPSGQSGAARKAGDVVPRRSDMPSLTTMGKLGGMAAVGLYFKSTISSLTNVFKGSVEYVECMTVGDKNKKKPCDHKTGVFVFIALAILMLYLWSRNSY